MNRTYGSGLEPGHSGLATPLKEGSRMKLCKCVKSEINYYIKECNFTDEELRIFIMLSKGKSIIEISEKLSVSESTVNRRVKSIMSKVMEVVKLKDNSIPVWEKVMLTVEEASQYSNIGVNKISSMLNEPGCPFIFCVGKGKRLVKRKEFEKYIEKTIEV